MKTTSLVEYASDPAFAIDSNYRVSGWNDSAVELLGYSIPDAIGQPCYKVLQAFYPTGELLCSALCEARSCFSLGNKWTIDTCKIRHKNGEMITVGLSTLVLPPEAREQSEDDTVAVVFLRKASNSAGMESGLQPLRILTLGRFSLTAAGGGLDIDNWKRKQAVVVLKCLIMQLGRPVHREQLMEWLWSDTDPVKGWERLKVTMSFLRAKLREGGAPDNTIETVGESYVLRRDAVWVDSDEFCTLVARGWKLLNAGNRSGARSLFETAQGLYSGDYLEDEPYADWCAEERERLREIFLEMLAGLVKCYAEESQYLEASQICRIALLKDPCRESFLRALLANLANLGRSDWAVAQYLSWKHILEEEYGLQPTEETLELYGELVGCREETG